MTFKEFMEMYGNWNGVTKVNDDDLNTIVIGRTIKIMERMETFNPATKVKNYTELFGMDVVAFGFYDNKLCVRVR